MMTEKAAPLSKAGNWRHEGRDSPGTWIEGGWGGGYNQRNKPRLSILKRLQDDKSGTR